MASCGTVPPLQDLEMAIETVPSSMSGLFAEIAHHPGRRTLWTGRIWTGLSSAPDRKKYSVGMNNSSAVSRLGTQQVRVAKLHLHIFVLVFSLSQVRST